MQAEVLREIRSAALDRDLDEDFGPWRKLYLEAAKRGEVVVVLNA